MSVWNRIVLRSAISTQVFFVFLCLQANTETVPKFPVATSCFSCRPPDLVALKLHSHCCKRHQIIFYWPKWIKKLTVINQKIHSMNIVTYGPITRQRLGKHFPSEAYARNNRTFNDRRRISKQSFSTTEKLWFLRGPCLEVTKGQMR
jgi:hypothetical protein